MNSNSCRVAEKFGPPKTKTVVIIRHICTALGMLCCVVVTGALFARYRPVDNHLLVIATAAFPLLSLSGMAALLVFVATKRWLLSSAATVLTVIATAVQLPTYLPADGDADGDTVPVRVLTANLYLGQADSDALARSAESRADILAVQELTHAAAQHLSLRLAASFPFQLVEARDGAAGAGLWSRYPIHDARHIPGYTMPMLGARVRIDGVGVDPTVVVGHLAGPWPQPITDWQADMAQAHRTMTDLAERSAGGGVILMGDFNTTLDARPFRELLHNGFRDAAQDAGVGAPATYPANSAVPPLISIDHVITRGATAVSVSAVDLPGSDHRGLAATLEIAR